MSVEKEEILEQFKVIDSVLDRLGSGNSASWDLGCRKSLAYTEGVGWVGRTPFIYPDLFTQHAICYSQIPSIIAGSVDLTSSQRSVLDAAFIGICEE